MLALAMALLHEPDVLIIDELSLGLAPVMVQRLLATVQELKEQGQTMIIVEQSLNVALAVADRAIFMEKGEIRFDGPAAELAVRDDLARAVFLGGPTAVIDLLAVEVPKQVLLSGAMRGLAIGVLAVGMILDLPQLPRDQLRPRRAGGALRGAVRALRRQLALELLRSRSSSWWRSARCSARVLELVIVRRLLTAPRVVLLVATIGAAQLLLFLQFVLPDITSYVASRRRSPTSGWSSATSSCERTTSWRSWCSRCSSLGSALLPQPHALRASPSGRRPTTPMPPGSRASA